MILLGQNRLVFRVVAQKKRRVGRANSKHFEWRDSEGRVGGYETASERGMRGQCQRAVRCINSETRRHWHTFPLRPCIISPMVTSLLSVYKAIGAPVAIDLTVRDVELLRRTLVGIIGSCLATIILCAWTAVHPNITPRNRWKALWNRLKLVLWMVFVPELGLVWAIRQLFAAKDIRDEYNKSHPGEL